MQPAYAFSRNKLLSMDITALRYVLAHVQITGMFIQVHWRNAEVCALLLPVSSRSSPRNNAGLSVS